ncbi:MAG: histidine kinase [Alphaproteobacteria bacterium]|nr:MAG: histidine kinase [Alphaproteobacteria bacterium]
MTRGSLRLRLLVAAALSVAAALALSAAGLTLLFERHVERRVAAELEHHLDRIIGAIEPDTDGGLTVSADPTDPRFARPLSGLYWQVETEAGLLRSRSLWDAALTLPADELADGAVHQHRIAGPGGADLLAVERRVGLPARLGGGAARAVVAVDRAEIAAASRAFAADLLPYLAIVGALLIAAAYVQVAVGLRPLAAVRDRLAAIGGGAARRLGRSFPDEILPLAAEVDALLEAREAQLDKARARAADLAHGLKTPLQVLAGDVERLRRMGEIELAADVEAVATAMRRHVDRELARARMAAGAPNARAKVAEVAGRVTAVVARTPDGARLGWRVEIDPALVARIDPDDLAEALGNLLENAARHARSAVGISATGGAGRTGIVVRDDGPGIPPERLQDALARGGRVDESGGGAGLGLAIVQDIAEAWGGRLEIRTTASGLEAELILPG